MAKLGILQEIKENIDVYIHGLWILKSTLQIEREAYLVQKLLVGALLWAAAPIGQEVVEAGGGLANQEPSLVFCWFSAQLRF